MSPSPTVAARSNCWRRLPKAVPELGFSNTPPYSITYYFDDFDDKINGTSDADTIDGLGGDDHIWGGLGDDVIQGGAGNDVIKPTDENVDTVADWGYDEVHGGPGSDTLDFRKTTHNVALHGDEGVDYLKGGSAGDFLDGGTEDDHLWGYGGGDDLFGGWGIDYLYGGEGEDFLNGGKNDDHLFGEGENDVIWAEDGNDTLDGGDGQDVLHGGAGQDVMTGGLGFDTFEFHMQDSDPSNPDHITDFQAGFDRWVGAYDTIDFLVGQPGGTSSNYNEAKIDYDGGYNEAKNLAENWFAADKIMDGDLRYLFVTDGVDGYLFSDPFSNGTIDDGIILEGLNELSDFSYHNIL